MHESATFFKVSWFSLDVQVCCRWCQSSRCSWRSRSSCSTSKHHQQPPTAADTSTSGWGECVFVCKEFIDQKMKALYMHRAACKWVVQFTSYSISNNQNTNQCYCNKYSVSFFLVSCLSDCGLQVVDIMRVNVDKVLERDQKLSELDDRADALQAGASQFESCAAKLKNKYWWKNCKVSHCDCMKSAQCSYRILLITSSF